MTVWKDELTPSVALSPAAWGAFGLLLQLAPADQLPLTLFVQVATAPPEETSRTALVLVVVIVEMVPIAAPAPL